MTTLKEIIDRFEGRIEDDSLEGVKEFSEYLKVQEDCTISEEDLVYLCKKSNDIRSKSGKEQKGSSDMFFSVLFDYAMRDVKGEHAEEFKSTLYSLCKLNLSDKEEEDMVARLKEIRLPELKDAQIKCEAIKNVFEKYVLGSPGEDLGLTTHYVNGTLTIILGNMSYLEDTIKNK